MDVPGGCVKKEDHMKKRKAFIISFAVVLAATLGGGSLYAAEAGNGNVPDKNREETVKVQTAGVPAGDPDEDDASEHVVTLCAAGDNLYHDVIVNCGLKRDGTYNYDHIYEDIKEKIESFDIAVINQETVFAGAASGYAGYPSFNTPDAAGDALINAGFDVFLYANNHVLDRGEKALRRTVDYWTDNHPEAVIAGIHTDEDTQNDIVIVEKNGIKIAILNYTYGTNGWVSQDKSYMVEMLDRKKVAKDLKRARKKADITIVFPHWGEEYRLTATESQKEWAQFFADNGADLIIGSHPHILEPVETITSVDGRDVICYYSLGNFVANMNYPEQTLGGLAEITIVKDADGTRIESAGITVTVAHFGYEVDGYIKICELGEYTNDQAKLHRRAYRGLTVKSLKKFAKDVLGEWYK